MATAITAVSENPKAAEVREARAIEAEALTEIEPEGLYEVVDGAILEKPAMGAYEIEIASILQSLLGPFARSNGLGRVVSEMLFRLEADLKRERRPDVAFVSQERWPIERRAPRANAWAVVPDLAIEVISPNNKTVDDIAKLEEYFQAGVCAVWFVFPEVAKIYVYQSESSVTILPRETTLEGGEVLPGFHLSLAELFGTPE